MLNTLKALPIAIALLFAPITHSAEPTKEEHDMFYYAISLNCVAHYSVMIDGLKEGGNTDLVAGEKEKQLAVARLATVIGVEFLGKSEDEILEEYQAIDEQYIKTYSQKTLGELRQIQGGCNSIAQQVLSSEK